MGGRPGHFRRGRAKGKWAWWNMKTDAKGVHVFHAFCFIPARQFSKMNAPFNSPPLYVEKECCFWSKTYCGVGGFEA
jgi:hypothetical protein